MIHNLAVTVVVDDVEVWLANRWIRMRCQDEGNVTEWTGEMDTLCHSSGDVGKDSPYGGT
jgi:hypothetical protein